MPWIVDPANPNVATQELTEFHQLRITFSPQTESMILETIDHRSNDVVHTQYFDYDDLNCCMEEP